MVEGFISSSSLAAGPGGKAWWFLCSGNRVLVMTDDSGVHLPLIEGVGDIGVKSSRPLYLGTLFDHPCYAARILDDEADLDVNALFRDLRTLYGVLEKTFFRTAQAAVHLVEWDETTRYCSRCRGELRLRKDIRGKECPDCKRLEFPRISPAIIVLIERGDKTLLARAARFTEPFYSVLAGFVEPGESLEEAVHREIKEEVGIEVKDIRYFGSQPWPFPDSLMIGFTAVHARGEIRIDGEEIVEAGWFHVHNLPRIPGRISIARQLIDWFLEKHSVGQET
jgi:NAD+ diphosphatase